MASADSDWGLIDFLFKLQQTMWHLLSATQLNASETARLNLPIKNVKAIFLWVNKWFECLRGGKHTFTPPPQLGRLCNQSRLYKSLNSC